MNPDLEWQRRYEQNDTPWDKGIAAPALTKYLAEHAISGRVLVPGCGRGHDARELAMQPDVAVVGLDLSPMAVEEARELAAVAGMACELNFIEGDFFRLPENLKGSFDWLMEHTCFCAIEPHQREDYVRAAAAALKPGGKIFAIFYINPDVDSGPPFAVSKQELSALFEPHFNLLEEWVPQESFPGREDRELVRILQKR